MNRFNRQVFLKGRSEVLHQNIMLHRQKQIVI